ncbi:MAG: ATP-dependent helicase [Anaerolineales bacterium]|nr:ATP-dependent helicase [Anaerolineales bacterium]
MFEPRPKQQEVLAYKSGMMGVSAVPGSGKTQTLSYLAAEIISQGLVSEEQEVLVVTLVNSAVDNFSNRVARFVQERGLLPNVNYRVRTLHGLAHDIVRERPALAGLADDFQIIDDIAAQDIIRSSAVAWLKGHPFLFERYLRTDLKEYQLKRIEKDYLAMIESLSVKFIQQAKDLRQTPRTLRDQLDALEGGHPFLEMGVTIFAEYQQALSYSGAVDFTDLIVKALIALQADPAYLARLQHSWPYILEDEAQDSSRLQETILRLLAGSDGNWVRMGDPNQAIFETFTTASPEYLRSFLAEDGVVARTLPNSGRSSRMIIDLANFLVDWSRKEHPCEAVRSALSEPFIEPTPPGDPQPNPSSEKGGIRLIGDAFSPEEELEQVARSIEHWLQGNPGQTAAVLVPSNQRGSNLAKVLAEKSIPYLELLRSTVDTRQAAGSLTLVLDHLAEPTSAGKLARVYKVFRRDDREEAAEEIQAAGKLLRQLKHVEDYLWPMPGADWLAAIRKRIGDPILLANLEHFRAQIQRWQHAVILPVDQLILTIAQDVFKEAVDLALAYRLALALRSRGDLHPEWDLNNYREELAEIAHNRRNFPGLSSDDTGFDPDAHAGKVVITTAHKAKGLEWDRVYILSVNDYDYPSAIEGERYLAEKWFFKPGFNLEAEVLAKLKLMHQPDAIRLLHTGASIRAREEYASERLRLLYVGITRARRELVITWNTGRRGDQLQAAPFIALQTYWEDTYDPAG